MTASISLEPESFIGSCRRTQRRGSERGAVGLAAWSQEVNILRVKVFGSGSDGSRLRAAAAGVIVCGHGIIVDNNKQVPYLGQTHGQHLRHVETWILRVIVHPYRSFTICYLYFVFGNATNTRGGVVSPTRANRAQVSSCLLLFCYLWISSVPFDVYLAYPIIICWNSSWVGVCLRDVFGQTSCCSPPGSSPTSLWSKTWWPPAWSSTEDTHQASLARHEPRFKHQRRRMAFAAEGAWPSTTCASASEPIVFGHD